MVKVCGCCSNVELEALKTVLSEDQIEVGCIEQCQGFDGKAFGLVDGELVVAENSDQFIAQL